MSATTVALQATQELLHRLRQPTLATVAAENANINKMDAFHRAITPAPGSCLTALWLPQEQYAALMWHWCGVAKLLLQLIALPASVQSPGAVLGAGKLLSSLSYCLESWVGMKADMAAQTALQQQIVQHTKGNAPDWRCGCMRVGYGVVGVGVFGELAGVLGGGICVWLEVAWAYGSVRSFCELFAARAQHKHLPHCHSASVHLCLPARYCWCAPIA
jgi:hypothetical protein